jgi:hypothetical protein
MTEWDEEAYQVRKAEREAKKLEMEIADKKLNKYLLWGFIAWLVIGLTMCDSGSAYGPGCYDADPTYYEDIICE